MESMKKRKTAVQGYSKIGVLRVGALESEAAT